MKYLIYLRVSTDQQEVETQQRMCIERIKQIHPQGDYTYEVFSDPDMSSRVAIEKRVELQKMLKAVKKGQTVLVYKLDRLSRDVIEMVTIYRMIVNESKAKVISLNDPYSDEFSVGLMGLIAQKERDDIRVRTKDRLATKRNKGERYSRFLPYGYSMDEKMLIPVKVGHEVVYKPGVLVAVAHEQEVISLMKELFAEGKSYQRVAEDLTDQGYTNREGRPFQKMSIYRILARIGQTRSSDQPQEETEALQSHSG